MVRMTDSCEEISKATDVIKGISSSRANEACQTLYLDLVKQLDDAARKYDYDENTPGNGLR